MVFLLLYFVCIKGTSSVLLCCFHNIILFYIIHILLLFLCATLLLHQFNQPVLCYDMYQFRFKFTPFCSAHVIYVEQVQEQSRRKWKKTKNLMASLFPWPFSFSLFFSAYTKEIDNKKKENETIAQKTNECLRICYPLQIYLIVSCIMYSFTSKCFGSI